MIDITPLLLAMMDHAEHELPRESCGLVISKDQALHYVPCTNLAKETEHFILDPEQYAEAEDQGEVVAIVHSHPYQSVEPSMGDRVALAKSSIPWIIVNPANGQHSITYPEQYEAPLLGRPFVSGSLDCYGLVRDYYKRECGIAMRDYDRAMWWWRDTDQDLYTANFQAEGFVQVHVGALDSDSLKLLQPHDALLIRYGSRVPNHAAVHIGDGVIMHHLVNQASCKAVLGEFYLKRTAYLLRHRSLIEGG